MFRLSVHVRLALARLTLPVLLVAAFGLMLVGKADVVLAERGRMGLADALAPVFEAMAEPLARARAVGRELLALGSLQAENQRLREENDRLRRWHAVATALDAENTALKAHLRWTPDPAPSWVSARVMADAGGVYARSVLLAAGPDHALAKGQIALDDRGLVGRITELGSRTARVLLLTDLNSRVPVTLEGSRGRAILVGANTGRPRLTHWPDSTPPVEGERVVTSAEAGVFPAGLPVGTVRLRPDGMPEVEPDARLDRLEVVRLFDYGLRGVQPPEQSARRR